MAVETTSVNVLVGDCGGLQLAAQGGDLDFFRSRPSPLDEGLQFATLLADAFEQFSATTPPEVDCPSGNQAPAVRAFAAIALFHNGVAFAPQAVQFVATGPAPLRASQEPADLKSETDKIRPHLSATPSFQTAPDTESNSFSRVHNIVHNLVCRQLNPAAIQRGVVEAKASHMARATIRNQATVPFGPSTTSPFTVFTKRDVAKEASPSSPEPPREQLGPVTVGLAPDGDGAAVFARVAGLEQTEEAELYRRIRDELINARVGVREVAINGRRMMAAKGK